MPYEDSYKEWLEKMLIEMSPDWLCDGMHDNEFTYDWCEKYCGKEDLYITPKCLHIYYHHIARAEQTENCSEKPNNCETCANSGSYKCTKCDGEMYFKTEPITHDDYIESENDHLEARCLNCNNAKACKEKHWEGCVYEPKDEKTCESCRHWKYIAKEWQCEAYKCQGYEPKTEPQTESVGVPFALKALQEYLGIKREPTLLEIVEGEPQAERSE